MAKNFIRNLTGKKRDKKTDTQLGVALAFIAGAINAGGFLAVGYYTSHMSGIVSSIADYIVIDKFDYAFAAALFLLSFISGATTSCVIINYAREKEPTSEFALALMLESVLLIIFGLSAANYLGSFELSLNITISLLCFIMGLQNAIITKISDSRIRTTHVTGISTDIGIEMGRYLYSHICGGRIAFHPERLKLHLILLVSFLTGGIIGAFSFKYIGFITTLPLAFILAILASVPIFDDFMARNKQ